MADTTKILEMGESVPNAILPLRLALEDMIESYNSSQERLWRVQFAADVIKAVAEERGEDFGELHGLIEETLGARSLFPTIAKAAEEGAEYLEKGGIDKFLAFQIAQKAAEKMPPEGQRGGKQIHEGSYVEFEAVSYNKLSKEGELPQCHVLGTKIRYKPCAEQISRELGIWDSESGSYKNILPGKKFFVGNLLPIEIENNDDSVFVYYTVRIAITGMPEQPSEETPAYEKPAERRPTHVDIEAAKLFASAEAGWIESAPEEAVAATLKEVMAGQGGNGTNGDVKKPRRLDAADSRRLMRVHIEGGGSAYAPQ